MAVACHVLLISLQVNTASGVRVFEGVTFGLFAEVQRLVSGSVEQLSDLWEGYVGLVEVQAENDALRRGSSPRGRPIKMRGFLDIAPPLPPGRERGEVVAGRFGFI